MQCVELIKFFWGKKKKFQHGSWKQKKNAVAERTEPSACLLLWNGVLDSKIEDKGLKFLLEV